MSRPFLRQLRAFVPGKDRTHRGEKADLFDGGNQGVVGFCRVGHGRIETEQRRACKPEMSCGLSIVGSALADASSEIAESTQTRPPRRTLRKTIVVVVREFWRT